MIRGSAVPSWCITLVSRSGTRKYASAKEGCGLLGSTRLPGQDGCRVRSHRELRPRKRSMRNPTTQQLSSLGIVGHSERIIPHPASTWSYSRQTVDVVCVVISDG